MPTRGQNLLIRLNLVVESGSDIDSLRDDLCAVVASSNSILRDLEFDLQQGVFELSPTDLQARDALRRLHGGKQGRMPPNTNLDAPQDGCR